MSATTPPASLPVTPPTEAEIDLIERIGSTGFPDRQPMTRKVDLLRAHVAAEVASATAELKVEIARLSAENKNLREAKEKYAEEVQQLAEILIGGPTAAPFRFVREAALEASADKARWDLVEHRCLEVRCENQPTGGDDYAVSWFLLEDGTELARVGEMSGPRALIDAARSSAKEGAKA